MDQEKWYCDLCKLNFSSEQEFREHSWSMLHHRKYAQTQGRDILHRCNLCGEEMFALLAFTKHIHQEKHQAELMKWKYQSSNVVKDTHSISHPIFNNKRPHNLRCRSASRRYVRIQKSNQPRFNHGNINNDMHPRNSSSVDFEANNSYNPKRTQSKNPYVFVKNKAIINQDKNDKCNKRSIRSQNKVTDLQKENVSQMARPKTKEVSIQKNNTKSCALDNDFSKKVDVPNKVTDLQKENVSQMARPKSKEVSIQKKNTKSCALDNDFSKKVDVPNITPFASESCLNHFVDAVAEQTQDSLNEISPTSLKIAPVKSVRKNKKLKKKTESPQKETSNCITANCGPSKTMSRKYPTRNRSSNIMPKKKLPVTYSTNIPTISTSSPPMITASAASPSLISSVSTSPVASSVDTTDQSNSSYDSAEAVISSNVNTTISNGLLSRESTTAVNKEHQQHPCEFLNNNSDACLAMVTTDKRFCDYHKRVVDAVELYITKKVSANTSSVSGAVSLIESPPHLNTELEDSKSSLESSMVLRKRSFSESSVDVNEDVAKQVNLKRFKSKAKKSNLHENVYSTFSSDNNDSSLPSIDLTSHPLTKINKLSRFKYLRTLTSSTAGQHEMYKANLPPTVRKLLDKKQSQVLEPRFQERTASQSESESESLDSQASPTKNENDSFLKRLSDDSVVIKNNIDFESEKAVFSNSTITSSSISVSNPITNLHDRKIMETLFNIPKSPVKSGKLESLETPLDSIYLNRLANSISSVSSLHDKHFTKSLIRSNSVESVRCSVDSVEPSNNTSLVTTSDVSEADIVTSDLDRSMQTSINIVTSDFNKNVQTPDLDKNVQTSIDIVISDLEKNVQTSMNIVSSDLDKNVQTSMDIVSSDLDEDMQTSMDIVSPDFDKNVQTSIDIVTSDLDRNVRTSIDIITSQLQPCSSIIGSTLETIPSPQIYNRTVNSSVSTVVLSSTCQGLMDDKKLYTPVASRGMGFSPIVRIPDMNGLCQAISSTGVKTTISESTEIESITHLENHQNTESTSFKKTHQNIPLPNIKDDIPILSLSSILEQCSKNTQFESTQKKLIQLQNEEDLCLEKMCKANYRLERLKTAMGKVQAQVSIHTTTLKNINKLKKKMSSELILHQQNQNALLKTLSKYCSTPLLSDVICKRSSPVLDETLSNTAHGIDKFATPLAECTLENLSDLSYNNTTNDNNECILETSICAPSVLSNSGYSNKGTLKSSSEVLSFSKDLNSSTVSSNSQILDGCTSSSNNDLYYSVNDVPDSTVSAARSDGNQRVITKLSNTVTCMKVYDDLIFISTNKPNGAVIAYDIKGEKPAVYLCQKQNLPVNCMEVVMTTHGKYLFTGCRGGKVKGYKFYTWELYHHSKHLYGELLSLHFAFKVLFIGFVNGTILQIFPESNKVSEEVFQRLGNKRRGVTCMTSTFQNGVEILYSGSRHGMIYARSIKGDLINKLGKYRKASTVFELRITNGCLFAVIDDVIRIYDCIDGSKRGSINTNCSFVLDGLRLSLTHDFLFMIDYQSLTTVRCCDLMTQKFSNLHQCKSKMKISNLGSDGKALVFITSSGDVIAMDIPKLSLSNTHLNQSFMKRRKQPRSDKIHCEACYTCYSSEDLKKRHQEKYTCKTCQKCFSYSTRGLGLVLERHLAISHPVTQVEDV